MAAHINLTAGTIIGDAYRIDRPLSSGGMGTVYVVTHLQTRRQRALKVMMPALARDPRFRDRFYQESQVGAAIHSEHVVEVMDAGVDKALGMPWLVMELLEGSDLLEIVTQRGPMARDQIVTIYQQLAHALSAAHGVGVVHRDLKPENLFLARTRRADTAFTLKILDFGIAKIVAEAQTRNATQSIGTPLWMAPEQTSSNARIGPATDIWPLGLIAFYLLTGKLFWRVANQAEPVQMELLREVVYETLPKASARAADLGVAQLLPAGFDGWFERCLAREPADRFRSVDDMAARLVPLLAPAARAPGVRAVTAGTGGALDPASLRPLSSVVTTVEQSPEDDAKIAAALAADPSVPTGIVAPHIVTSLGPMEMGPHAVAPMRRGDTQPDPLLTHRSPQPAPVAPTFAPAIEARSPQIEARSPQIEARSPQIEARSPQIEARSPQIEARSPQIEAQMVAPPIAPPISSSRVSIPLPVVSSARSRTSPRSPWPIYGAIAGGIAIAGVVTVLLVARGCEAAPSGKKEQAACQAAFKESGTPADKSLAACKKACTGKASPFCRYWGDLLGRGNDEPSDAQVDAYRKGCSGSDEHACQRLLLAEEAQKIDAADRAEIHQKACDAGRASGCTRAGDIAERRDDKNDAARAVALFAEGCEGGDSLGCAWQAMMLDSGRRIKSDPNKAKDIFDKAKKGIEEACDEGSGLECVALGWMREHAKGMASDPLQAAADYRRACDVGIAAGCVNLGALHATGLGVNRDAKEALRLARLGCDLGEVAGCNNVGVMTSGIPTTLRTGPRGVTVFKLACAHVISVGCSGWGKQYAVGDGISADVARARVTLEGACEDGEQHACVNLGALLRYGLGGDRDAARAGALFKEACFDGNAGACGEYASMLWDGRGGVARDRAEARKMFTQACDWGEWDACSLRLSFDLETTAQASVDALTQMCDEQHIAMACSSLADLYFAGTGVTKNASQAFSLYERACIASALDRPHGRACVSLAYLHLNGLGTTKDPNKALSLLRSTCDQGEKLVCADLASLYMNGADGIAKDGPRGLQMAEKLCDEGLPEGCAAAGLAHAIGKVGARDDNKALPFLRKGCDLGSMGACANLAEFLAAGRGGATVDKARARELFQLACDDGVQWTCDSAKALR